MSAVKERRIFWTTEEKAAVVKAALNILKAGWALAGTWRHVRDRLTSQAMREAFRRAQEAIFPEHRHRPIYNDHHLRTVLPIFHAELDRLVSEELAAESTPRQAEAESVKANVQQHKYPSTEDLHKTLLAEFDDMKLGFLVEALVERVADRVVQKLAALDLFHPKPSPVDWIERMKIPKPAADAPKPKLPKVLVVGLLPKQEQLLVQAFTGRVRFVFYDKDKVLPRDLHIVDHVFVMTSYIGHDSYKRLKKVYPAANLTHVTGLVADVKVEIDRYLKRVEGV